VCAKTYFKSLTINNLKEKYALSDRTNERKIVCVREKERKRGREK